eukprot:GHVS01076294.1.p1 GENE.GHVS01076294.1~~GHVS01076294.1.p1  ORF type:complete len:292 (-),score=55.25 GHVS01076294.1:155-1030(-)
MLSTLQGQLASLRQKVPAAKCCEPAGDLWTIKLVTPDLQPICVISVKLPPGFPVFSGPLLSLSAAMQHPWIAADQTTIIGHPQLTPPWRAWHDVGKVVSDVISEFQQNPPRTNATIGGVAVARPACPSAFAALNSMSVEELEFLKSNPAALDQILWDSKEVKDLLSQLTCVVDTATHTAKAAASQQLLNNEGYADVKLLVEDIKKECDNANTLSLELNSRNSGRSLSSICDLLTQEAYENRKQAERVGQRLQSHQVDWNEFERVYFEERRVYHRKQAKRQRTVLYIKKPLT